MHGLRQHSGYRHGRVISGTERAEAPVTVFVTIQDQNTGLGTDSFQQNQNFNDYELCRSLPGASESSPTHGHGLHRDRAVTVRVTVGGHVIGSLSNSELPPVTTEWH